MYKEGGQERIKKKQEKEKRVQDEKQEKKVSNQVLRLMKFSQLSIC